MSLRAVVGVGLLPLAGLVWSSTACATPPPRDAVAVQSAAPDFTLPVAGAAPGDSVSLASERARNKLTVVMFIATQCPVSNAYNDRMAQLARDYGAKGIGFIGVNANKQEAGAEIAAHAKEHGFLFPVVKDEGNKVADLYGARVTPEIFIVDPSGKVRYHGRIDEKMSPEKPDDIKSPDLRTALDALLAGKPAPQPETKAFGCSIKRL